MKIILSVLFACAVLVSTAGNTDVKKSESKSVESVSTVVFSGKIVDSESKESLAGVRVSLANSNMVVFTDFDGNFKIEIPTEEVVEKEIKVSYISYEETLVIINGENKKTIELTQVQ